MTDRAASEKPLSADRALHHLFLTLFLRGRSSRGLQKGGAPTSMGGKLWLTILIYALVGLAALFFRGQPVFSLALYLHGMTLVFLGMTVASSAGEMLFNKEEADILLHRPVTPGALLRAKIGVLVKVSLWLAGAFNLAGLFAGVGAAGGGWMFPIAHVISTSLQALFCTGFVVLGYELCLRWFGRERLESLMTTVQVIVAVAAVGAGQIVPRLLSFSHWRFTFSRETWWGALLPPAWFAGLDQVLCGHGDAGAWILAVIGLAAVALVLWMAFAKLAHHYGEGLQVMGEAAAGKPAATGGRRWLGSLVESAPMRWWLHDPVTRASFLLTVGYLLRDRDVKLRVYPGLAPMLMMPVIFLIQDRGRGELSGAFGMAFSGGFVGLIALLGVNLLQYSQQWQAAEVFRLAPMAGPARICSGARRAVLFFLAGPLLMLFAVANWFLRADASQLLLLLPGLISIPVFALAGHLGGRAIPLSVPGEEAKSASRGIQTVFMMMISMALSGLTVWAWKAGWFWWFVGGEAVIGAAIFLGMRAALNSAPWPPIE